MEDVGDFSKVLQSVGGMGWWQTRNLILCSIRSSIRIIGADNLELIHTGTSILYDWDILGSSIYIVDILRIDDQSSILRSSIYRVFTQGRT